MHVTLRGDGNVVETTHVVARLEHEDDARNWTVYRVPLYDNRTLERFAARAELPGGRVVTAGDEDRDTVEGGGGNLFYASLKVHRVRLRGLVPGAVVTIDHEVLVRPYFPTGRVVLRGGDAVADLRVVVEAESGAVPEGWRWYVEGPTRGLTVQEGAAGITVKGRDLSAIAVPELAPAGGAVRPVLRYGWGDGGTWADVGRWYRELAVSVPRSTAEIEAEAVSLVAGLADPRRRLDALVGFLQDKVRNVAVLVGDGNYRPSPPAEVLERRWGDCKDKAVLLVDLLRSAGIDAYLTLIHKNARRRIDSRFPSPDQFNHAIVAVPSQAVPVTAEDPVGDGYLFIDPTQVHGAGRWLDPDAQDQDVLVVRNGASRLVKTPLRADLESRHLEVDLTVETGGGARGRARLEIRGELAYELILKIGGLAPEAMIEEVRSIFAGLLPGAVLDEVSWTIATEGVPSIELETALVLAGLVQGGQGRRSLRLTSLRATPDPQLLRDRVVPMAVPARSARATWNLTLPPGWCPAMERDDGVENPAGVFRKVTAVPEPGSLRVDHRVELRKRWFAAAELPALRELALAEHRAHRRRTRLRCGEP